jgi:hypothetical protein
MRAMKTIANSANSTLFEIERRKIENATERLTARHFNFLHNDVLPQNKENAMIICNYIQSMKQELNLSDGYRKDIIILLGNFSMFYKKSFLVHYGIEIAFWWYYHLYQCYYRRPSNENV